MKAALLAFLAATAFAVAAAAGIVRVGSSRPPPPTVVVLRDAGSGAGRAVHLRRGRRQTVVLLRVEQARLSAFRGRP
jgi:hypothetical protein